MSKRKIIPYALLLITFLVWLHLTPKEVLTALPEHHPSFIVHHLDSTHFDETGAIAYKITATKSTHFSNKKNTLLTNPSITFYSTQEHDDKPSVWELSAEIGILSGTHKLVLSDNVWLRNLSQDQSVQTMQTEELNILLQEKEISSDLLVLWEGPQMKQQGIGMWASLVNEELIVNKQIEAVYLNETK